MQPSERQRRRELAHRIRQVLRIARRNRGRNGSASELWMVRGRLVIYRFGHPATRDLRRDRGAYFLGRYNGTESAIELYLRLTDVAVA